MPLRRSPWVVAACLGAGSAHCGAARDPGLEVRAVLEAQVAAWNRGDVDGYMQGYWDSPELRFVSGGTVTYGWGPTLERYRARYADRASMGTLTFSDVDVRPAGDGAAFVFGAWRIARAGGSPHGLFTLVVRRTAAGWRVVHDHTSSAE
jgi:ketosteroid isomerase-like protein